MHIMFLENIFTSSDKQNVKMFTSYTSFSLDEKNQAQYIFHALYLSLKFISIV